MTSANLAISPALRDALSSWLERLRALDGAAANTVAAYGRDVAGFLGFLALHRAYQATTDQLLSLAETDAPQAHELEALRALEARTAAAHGQAGGEE